MGRTGSLLATLFLMISASSLQAADLSPANAQSMISALKIAGVQGRIADDGSAVVFDYDVSCTRSQNPITDPNNSNFGVDNYTCDVGAGKKYLSQAKVIHDAILTIFSAPSTADAEVNGLLCTIHLGETNFEQRFTCSYQE